MGRPESRRPVLTLQELNRATLARQLLLERKRISPAKAIEHLAGMQAQWPPAPYVGLWSRVDGFRREALERAILRGEVLKPTLMRGTLHLITRRDYPTFWWALRDMPTWYQAEHAAQAAELVDAARALAPLTHADGLAWLESRGHTAEADRRRIFFALRRRAHLLHPQESSLFDGYGRAIVFQAHDHPDELDVTVARTAIVRRYLAAFGPASRTDISTWCGLRVTEIDPALEALEPLRRFVNEDGKELVDLQRAPLPPADTPAPVRFLPKWDNVLLSFKDRRRMFDPALKDAIIATNGDVGQTVLVDGRVVATWDKHVEVTYLEAATRTQKAEVAAEADRLKAWFRA
ncbi:MAG: winged helix DNA-binding domain-containing protein [Actinomycetota bacterium]